MYVCSGQIRGKNSRDSNFFRDILRSAAMLIVMERSNLSLHTKTNTQQLRERISKARDHRASAKPPASTPAPVVDNAPTPSADTLPEEAQAVIDSLVELHVELGAVTESNLYTGFSGDVTSGGVFICTHQHLQLMEELGRRVAVTITFPGGKETRALGLVHFARDEFETSHTNSPGIGVQFVALTPQGRRFVDRFARIREPLFFCD